mmetsp:Transcript_15060/g.31675  ORF Transcript_15060/g.31675 Transcript_15060/m.31675 type:complete len:87 (+) Transcript_15060:184-444(+)
MESGEHARPNETQRHVQKTKRGFATRRGHLAYKTQLYIHGAFSFGAVLEQLCRLTPEESGNACTGVDPSNSAPAGAVDRHRVDAAP